MQFIRVGDVSLHYQVIGGAADNPMLVFINSLGTDFRIWRDVIVRLAGDQPFPLLVYDKRGHGLSDVGNAPYTIDDHVDDLVGLLDHLQVRRTILVGLSVGGLIAQGLFARRPDLVHALILCDTAHKIGTDAMWNARIAAIEEGGLEDIADAVMERWFTPSFRSQANAAYPGYRNMMLRQPEAGYTGTCAAIRDADFTETAKRISVPVLCVVGNQDGSTPPDLVREMAGLIPGARFEVISAAGHIPCVEQPEALSEVLSAFISSTISGEASHG